MSVLKPPSWRMKLGGLDFQAPDLVRKVMKIEVTCVDNGPDSFTVELDDADGKLADSRTLKEGGSALILLGYTGGPYHEVMDGLIKGVEAKREGKSHRTFTVTGFDHSHGLTEGRQNKTWKDIKDSDIAKEAGQKTGLEVEADDTGIVRPYVMVNNQTWFEFLTERAALYGFELSSRGKKMKFKKPDPGASVCDLIYDHSNYIPSNPKHVVVEDINFETSTAGQVTEVVVRHQDPLTALLIEGRSGDVIGTTMGGNSTGGEAAASSTKDSTLIITDVPVNSVEEAEKVAFDRLNKINGSFVTAKGKCRGDARIMPQEVVTVDSVGLAVDGDYLVKSAKHLLEAGSDGFGFLTEFELRRTGR